jgi:cardiolipin synthase A/B
MARLIASANHNIQLQTYIFRADQTGERIRSALIDAARRGVRVRLLLDALGSHGLPDDFFAALVELGGELRLFNPLNLRRFIYRHHRKVLICDRHTVILGGFNIGNEYDGDGIESGWCDLGMQMSGGMASELASAFDRLYLLAADTPRRFARLRSAQERRRVDLDHTRLLFSGPGRGANPMKASLLRDLAAADSVRVISPYFLPTWGLRRRLMKLARRGGRVQLLLPGISDVPMARHASRSLYARLLRAGVEIMEYQPQILHAKLVLANGAVYVGSANFNTRSLHIDYELLLRLEDPSLVRQADGLFEALLEHAVSMDRAEWRRRRSLWDRLRQRLAYFIMARLDPLVAGWLWREAD